LSGIPWNIPRVTCIFLVYTRPIFEQLDRYLNPYCIEGHLETKSIVQPLPSGIFRVFDPPPLRSFQFPPWWAYGYFLEPHVTNLDVDSRDNREISSERFRKIRKLLYFRNANHSSKSSRNSWKKIKCNENPRLEISENFGIPRKAVFPSFPEIVENAVPFVTGNFRKFKPEFFVKRKAPM